MSSEPEAVSRAGETGWLSAVWLGRMLRPSAWLALTAVVMGQGVSPACKSSGFGSHGFIEWLDLAASFGSQLFACVVIALLIGMLFVVSKDTRVRLVSRVMLVGFVTMVLVVSVPAVRFKIPVIGSLVVGLMSTMAAVVSAVEGLREPRSRALGFVLLLMGLGGWMRVFGVGVQVSPWHALTGTQLSVGSVLLTVSVVLHGVGLLVGLAWLASRNRGRTVSLGTLLALLAATFFSWVSAAAHGQVPTWVVFVARFQDKFVSMPLSMLPQAVDRFVGVLGISAAVVA
ncbi:MAG: hypothetical protein FWD57_12965, partial [Polyangiaceae bacterium]|nr:hypothetical protein [Polyangiaceae bacterium]